MDWSWGNLMNKGKGILADPSALASNPMFSAGMGILGETRKPFGGDPFGAAMGGLLGAKQQRQADEDRKRQEELREQLKKWMAAQAGHKAPGGGQVPNPFGAGMVPASGSVAATQQLVADQTSQVPYGGGTGITGPEDFQQRLMNNQLPGLLTLRLIEGGGLDKLLGR